MEKSMNWNKMVEDIKIANLDPSKKAGAAPTRHDAVAIFQKFLDRKRVKYINDIEENDFIQARNQKGAWTYSPASDKEVSKGQEEFVGYYIQKEKITEDVIYTLYKESVQGKVIKITTPIKETIEQKYAKYI
jgi:hypothetical protein